jgi:UDP-2-acetamido-2-deoxy-ribo-hexuluronate aminotransferase
MPLIAHDVGPGDAVVTTPFTFIATAEVIQLLGATPVFVDIEADTFNISPEKLVQAIETAQKSNTLTLKGILPVDLFGQPAEYDEINDIAAKYDMFVIEDAAQSFGASYRGRRACSLADVASTSFFPAKPLGCYGDGGMIFTDNDELYEKLVSIRIHGKGSNKYDNVRVGINGRLDTLQAAVLLAKMEIFSEEIELRQQVAERYARGLQGVVKTPVVKDHNVSAWAQYSILHPNRDQMINTLKGKNIPTAIYYPLPLHLQGAFSHLGYQQGDFPVSEKVSADIFSLPFHPYLTAEMQAEIIAAIK